MTGGDTHDGGAASLEITEGQKHGLRLFDA